MTEQHYPDDSPEPKEGADIVPVMPPSELVSGLPSKPFSISEPPSLPRQMAQLIVIPAMIVIVCVVMVVAFGFIGAAPDKFEDQLAKLRSSSGHRKMPLGMQSPRYQERMRAAVNVAQMIPSIKEGGERQEISDELVDILYHHVGEDEEVLQYFLLIAIGQLGREGGFDPILYYLESTTARVVEGAIGAVTSWPDPKAARQALPLLVQALQHPSAMVRMKAAAAIGQLAQPNDANVVKALHEAMILVGADMREASWNAAVALARLGDERGSQLVGGLLLDRQQLAKLPSAAPHRANQTGLSLVDQDQIIQSTLLAAEPMTHRIVRDKIQQIADNDPNMALQTMAKNVLNKWKQNPR